MGWLGVPVSATHLPGTEPGALNLCLPVCTWANWTWFVCRRERRWKDTSDDHWLL